MIDGIEREFFDYLGRDVLDGPDEGTLAPWAVVASLPFAPDTVLPAIRCCVDQVRLGKANRMTSRPRSIRRIRTRARPRTACPPIVSGLPRAGFRGGWL
ncbi:MAG: glucoamylase family protein [Chloroflexota bacterium]